MAGWSIRGNYMETCNCEFLCPCIASNLADTPTEGECKAAIALQIVEGSKGDVKLDGLSFIVMMHSPGAMGAGNLKVGLIVDERASDEQANAIAAIASGAEGGPMAALAPLLGSFEGVERAPISFEADGLNRIVRAGSFVDQACEGVPSVSAPGEVLAIDNVAHPVNTRLGLARATRSLFKVFGIEWSDSSGSRNAHIAPFAWSG